MRRSAEAVLWLDNAALPIGLHIWMSEYTTVDSRQRVLLQLKGPCG